MKVNEELVRQAQLLATGADVHAVNTMVACYRMYASYPPNDRTGSGWRQRRTCGKVAKEFEQRLRLYVSKKAEGWLQRAA